MDREKIQNFLLEKGFKPNLLGFKYLTDAIDIILLNEDYQYSITTKLYPCIASKENTTCSKVERAIRHALESAKLRFTNSHFIALAVLEIQKNTK